MRLTILFILIMAGVYGAAQLVVYHYGSDPITVGYFAGIVGTAIVSGIKEARHDKTTP